MSACDFFKTKAARHRSVGARKIAVLRLPASGFTDLRKPSSVFSAKSRPAAIVILCYFYLDFSCLDGYSLRRRTFKPSPC